MGNFLYCRFLDIPLTKFRGALREVEDAFTPGRHGKGHSNTKGATSAVFMREKTFFLIYVYKLYPSPTIY